MKALQKLRYKLRNLSATAIRDIIVIISILCLSVALSIPSLKEDLKEYQNQKINIGTGIETETGSTATTETEISGTGTEITGNGEK